MNLKSFLCIGLGVLAANSMFAQANILNAKIPEEIGMKTEAQLLLDNDKPLEYGYVGDRDILFSKMTWEKIVLDERANFPLYFPIEENLGDDRKSLYMVLMENITNGTIPKVYADAYFTEERTMEDLAPALVMERITDVGIDWMNAEGVTDTALVPEEYKIRREIGPADINSYLVKGLWYFDKRQGELKYRILGIAPAAPDVNFIDSDDEANKEPIGLFWIFFPEIRDILHEAKAFNNKNSAVPLSFDHLLNSRRFSSVIYKEENVYGDREVKEYVAENALMQLLESERIKDKIRNFEQDMWSY
ncbi:type IX secretion system ring subunit PorN/GldN [Winogradskyella sediminis]|uniref:Gliding motility associated protien GldN n=1 Tax=Winogradskyella sediminis TaxID=1382466 RepID=A0A1H1PBW7_9FLAO|nr:gliding motility protein GldN [Winogradskyella sediminis]REG90102.1 protein involved in gliding motility GldN [Winogradskyella sediminis]SDS08788.1 gliding motility associated protien GldN [Winogradskyella sediminis]